MSGYGSQDPAFDELDDDKVDENAQTEGRTRSQVSKKKEIADDEVNTEEGLSTAEQKVSTDRLNVSTDRSRVSTDMEEVSIDRPKDGTDAQADEGTEPSRVSTDAQADEGTEPSTTTTTFGDDEIIAQLLLNMAAKAVSREKEKGIELKDVEDTEKPRPTSTRSLLTLKPLPKIDPKDKGKKQIEEEDESESESDDIPEAEKKFKQLAGDEELARKVQEEWEDEEERKRLAEEQATNEALIRNYDDIKARIEADRLLAEKFQEEEREQFTVEERAKFLHDTIAAQRRFLAHQRSEAIRNRPPTKNQLRNQMITYLKHVGNFKHSELKSKKFKEIQALYEKIKRSDEDFIAIGSAEDERMIKKMNEKEIESSKDDSVKEKVKEEGEEKNLKTFLQIVPDEDEEFDYEVLDKRYPIIDWESKYYPYDIPIEWSISNIGYFRSDGSSRWIKTVTEMAIRFDRMDFEELYNLVMKRFHKSTPEGIDLIRWGDLRTMFGENADSDLWKKQEEWILKSWNFYENSGIHILVLEDDIELFMLAERRYPLTKETLKKMMDLKLVAETESDSAYDLLRFIQKQIDEFESQEEMRRD
ncbi:hypothetical protein Tco_0708190 [Tanacetum coccineum]